MRFLIFILAVSAFAQTQIRPTQIKGGSTGNAGATVIYPNNQNVWNEVVAGSGLVYTLKAVPAVGTLRVWRDGMRQDAGKYTLNGKVITFLFAIQPERGDGSGMVIADYQTYPTWNPK